MRGFLKDSRIFEFPLPSPLSRRLKFELQRPCKWFEQGTIPARRDSISVVRRRLRKAAKTAPKTAKLNFGGLDDIPEESPQDRQDFGKTAKH